MDPDKSKQTNSVENKSISVEPEDQSARAAGECSACCTRNRAAFSSSGILSSKCRAKACSICTEGSEEQASVHLSAETATTLQTLPLRGSYLRQIHV